MQSIRDIFLKTRYASADEFLLISHRVRNRSPYKLSGSKSIFCKILCILTILVICFISYYIYHRATNTEKFLDDLINEAVYPPPPSASQEYSYGKAAIVTNGRRCAEFANNILKKNGTVIEAAITALLCDGVSSPQSMGLGGGFLLTYYNREKKKAYSMNAREKAPGKAYLEMFKGNPNASQTGPLAAGVPGELRGYWILYKNFGGNLKWGDLFTEVIDLVETGIPISPHLAQNIRLYEPYIRNNTILTSLFINEHDKLKNTSDTFTWPSLAKTLRVIATEGGDALYNGTLVKDFVKDIQDGGGIITEEDMQNYQPTLEEPLISKIKSDIMYTSPLPGSGAILSFMLRVLENKIEPNMTVNDLLWHQRFTETMKYAYAARGSLGDVNNPDVTNPYKENINQVLSNLKSEEFIKQIESELSDIHTWQNPQHYRSKFQLKEDHGTANIVLLAPNGDAVAVTSTVNLVFGSRFVSNSTGIILNDEMDDFSSPNITNFFIVPPSPANYIQPHKKPISSMCPTIITDSQGDVKLVIGSAGGTKITTSIAQVTMLNLWMNQSIKQSVDAPRIHHQLYPMKYGYEHGTLKSVIRGMRKIGHQTSKLPNVFTSSVTAISVSNNKITANADFRRPGAVAGM